MIQFHSSGISPSTLTVDFLYSPNGGIGLSHHQIQQFFYLKLLVMLQLKNAYICVLYQCVYVHEVQARCHLKKLTTAYNHVMIQLTEQEKHREANLQGCFEARGGWVM